MHIIALIPARSGSKGIPNKNIKLYKGLPLMAHSINIAKQCKFINEVYVSTDSEEYQKIAVQYGAKVFELRPAEIADDLSPDIDTFKHFLKWCKDYNMQIPDIIIHLRPTYPNRTLELLNNCAIEFLSKYENYHSLRTVVKIKNSPYKMYYIMRNNLIPFITEDPRFLEPYNQARQNFVDTYLHNGCIDIVKTSVILKHGLLSGSNILPYIMDENETDDIDELKDFIDSEKKVCRV